MLFAMKRPIPTLILLATTAISAQEVLSIQPPNPTSVDRILLTIGMPVSYLDVESVSVVGSEIRITFRGVIDPLPTGSRYTVPVGPLPPGSYSIVVRAIGIDEDGDVAFDTTFPGVPLVVAPGYFVPALDVRGFALFAGALAVAGALLLRRMG